jgi:hypothetical protein
MKFSPDACVTCGTRFRNTFDSDYAGDNFISDTRGTLCGTRFWFCSDDCVTKALETFVEKRFHFHNNAYNDPDCPDHHIEEFAERWLQRANAAWKVAVEKLIHRALDEYHAWLDKFEQQQKKELDKYELSVQRQIKQMEAETREQERDVEKMRRDLERSQKELERKRMQVETQERQRQERKEREEREAFEQVFEQAHVDNELRQREDVFTPKPIPPQLRYEHIHILAPTGAGKTTLLQHLILKDFRDYGKEAAHVIIDPKGAMIERLAKLQVFDHAWADRLVIIDPFDQPAFNVFALKAQNAAQLISNFSYIFSTVGQKLTTPQETCFSYCAALLLRMPGANLTTLLELLEDGTGKPPSRGEPPPRDPRFTALVNSLTEPKDRQLRRYFEKDFYDTPRDLIKSRINTILSEENLAAIFDSRTSQIDIGDCIEKKKIVMVNTRLVEMGNKHQVLGRFIISLFQQAVLGRTSTHPAFLFIDEFQEFADEEKTPQLLRLIREYKGGAVLAHQNMVCAELTANSQAAISTNTIIKFASNPGADDLGRACKDLRAEPDFLTRVCVKEPDNSLFRFGCFFPGLKHPFVYQVRHDIKRYPTLSDQRYQEFRAHNRAALRDPPKKAEAPSRDGTSQPATEATGVAPTITPESPTPPDREEIFIRPPNLVPNHEGALFWTINISPTLAQSGGSIPLVLGRKDPTIQLTIPQGIRSGQKMRLKGYGSPHPDNKTVGDLYITIQYSDAPQTQTHEPVSRSDQDREIAPSQPPSDPSAPARWEKTKK